MNAPRNISAMVREMAMSNTMMIMECQFYTERVRLAVQFTARVLNPTTLTLLMGIRMAATSGVRFPETAKLNAMML